MSDNILSIKDLKTYFFTDNGVIKSVDGVNIDLKRGSTLGIVGESGSGKSVTALSLMHLLYGTQGKIVNGEIILDGEDIVNISEKEKRSLRGNKIAMIFQEPMTSLNPVLKIGDQIMEGLIQHLKVSKAEAKKRTIDMLKKTGISRAETLINEYPFQLSGGMRQRIMIAMALVCNPKILIADEPTTALDVTIQAQILDLMRKLKADIGTSIIFITHDLGVVAEMCDDVVVMYCGRVVESGNVISIFKSPKHPYTQGLLNSIPRLGENAERLDSIPGNVPNPKYMPVGCKFEPRCKMALPICKEKEPLFYDVGENHKSKCWLCDKNYGGEVNEEYSCKSK